MAGQRNDNGRQWKIATVTMLTGAALMSVPRFAACAATPLALIQASPQSVVSSGPLTLTAAIHSRVSEGQPAELMVTIYNSGPKELMIGGSAFEASSFDFTLTDGKGHTVPRTAQGNYSLTPPMSCANATVFIKPDQTLRYSFNLSRLFDLSRPGTYAVSIQRIFMPWSFPPSAPNLGRNLSPSKTRLTAGPLNFHIEETAAAKSGPVAYVPPPDHQTFLYMASTYGPSIIRYRVGADGGLSYTYHLPAKAPDTPAPPPTLGTRPDFFTVTPDYRFLYAKSQSAHIISQYKIGNDGVLSPLSPPTVPLPVETGTTSRPLPLLMAANGRFLYSETGAFYSINSDGGLTLKAMTDIDPNLRFLDGWRKYHIAPDGSLRSLSQTDYGATISTKTDSTKTEPVLYWGANELVYSKDYSSFESKSWAVDPNSHFLVVLRQNVLECYRIGGQKLTLLNKTEVNASLSSVFFIPGSPLVYVSSSNDMSNDLLVFGLDNKQGLIPTEVAPEKYIPSDASIIFASAPTPPVWGKAMNGLAISAHLPVDTQPTIQPVVLTVTLRNTTAKPLRLGTRGADMSAFHLSLTGPPRYRPFVLLLEHKPPDITVPLFAAGHDLLDKAQKDSKPLILPPGGKRQYRLVLSQLADLTQDGAYTVQVIRTFPNGKTTASPVVPFMLNDPPQHYPYPGDTVTLQVPS